jgi:hypothetical protein
MGKPCQICFSQRLGLADVLREEAPHLIEKYGWEGGRRVVNNIQSATSLISIRDHLAALRVAELLTLSGREWPTPRLEAPCCLHRAAGPHDIALPLPSSERTIVVEVKRFDRSTAGADKIEEETTDYICKHKTSVDDLPFLHEIKEDPTKSKRWVGHLMLPRVRMLVRRHTVDCSMIAASWQNE